MTFTALLTHSLVVQRALLGMPDDYGHAEPTWPDGETVKGLVQSLRGREIVGPSLGGQVVSDVQIFLAPVEIDEQDRLRDVTPGHGGVVYEIQFVEDAGGQAHHLEVFARLITSGEKPT